MRFGCASLSSTLCSFRNRQSLKFWGGNGRQSGHFYKLILEQTMPYFRTRSNQYYEGKKPGKYQPHAGLKEQGLKPLRDIPNVAGFKLTVRDRSGNDWPATVAMPPECTTFSLRFEGCDVQFSDLIGWRNA